MKCRNRIRPAAAGLLLLLCSCLSGCSISFCGFHAGKETYEFTCKENIAEEGSGEVTAEIQAQEAAAKETMTPTETEEALQVSQTAAAESDGKVNINTAGVEELTTLKGVGESRAKAIIAYREEHGSFQQPEEIMQITGIKEGIYAGIKDQIKVR